jgi:hypothetical protein
MKYCMIAKLYCTSIANDCIVSPVCLHVPVYFSIFVAVRLPISSWFPISITNKNVTFTV